MPDWTPPPDVVFDHAAATELINAAVAAMSDIGVAADLVRHPQEEALAEWIGAARDRYDDRRRRHESAIARILDGLAELSTSVMAAAAWAADEQARRDTLQRQWFAEAAEEDAERIRLAAEAAAAAADEAAGPEAVGAGGRG